MSASAAPEVGVDLVDIARFGRQLVLSPALLGRVFTSAERESAALLSGARRESYLAGRFAVKEAVLKALRVGLGGGVELTDIEVQASDSGAPVVALSGAAFDAARAQGFTRCVASISHDGGFAVAFALLS